MDRETLKKIVYEKLKKKNNNSVRQENSNNNVSVDKNSPEVNRGYKKNASLASHNFSSDAREKFSDASHNFSNGSVPKLSDASDAKPGISPQTSGEFSSENSEKIEDEGVEIKDNVIIIKTKSRHRFEIQYGFAGVIEDSTRIIDLKIPQLPQWNLVAKKGDEALSLVITVDFYQVEGKPVYYIRNKKEVVEKLYAFRGQRNISKKLISDALDIWLDRIDPAKHIKWIDVREVVEKYKEWQEINQDPLGFFLSRSTEVVGNEKLKVAVLLSVVSSQLKKLYGIYRVHLILTGSSGVGKSSTIKSVLKLFYDNADGVEDFIVLKLTRMTKEALGRLNVDTLDGKVIFVEQLDNVEGVDYIREAMSEDRITTLTTVKDSEGNLVSKTIVIPGQPAFVTTNVTANIDHQIINRSIQLYLSQVEDEKIKSKIIEAILERGEIEELGRLKLITYVWLKTRPSSPKMVKEVKDELVKLLSRFINFKNIYRATEITRNLVRATASMFGHEEIQRSDVEFVMKYFKKDIILTTLELSERDLQLLRWLRDHGFIEAEKSDETKDVTTSEVAQVVKMSTQETKKVLDALYDKGLLWKAYDGKRFTWAINRYGLRVLEELEREVEEQQQGEETDVIIEEQLLAYISSKLVGKEKVTEEELRSILERTAQAKDIEAQDLLIKILERKGIIKNEGDGTWKVL
jgi:GTPase SAR1 family protein